MSEPFKKSRLTRSLVLGLGLGLALGAPALGLASNPLTRLLETWGGSQSTQLAAAGTLEVAFSPAEGSEALIIKTIQSAKREICMLTYSFTSAPVVQALIRARQRGVSVRLVADAKSNLSKDDNSKSRAALSGLVNAGADVRTITAYAIHHDKVIIADRETVQTGSYNYSDAAARRNSENVLVNWHNPQLAAVYMRHFERNYAQALPYQLRY